MNKLQLATWMTLMLIGFRGDGIVQPNPPNLGYQATPKERISSCLVYGHGVRLNCPKLRRFVEADSLSPFGPGGLSPYAYVSDNVINRSDKTGYIDTLKQLSEMAVSMHLSYVNNTQDSPIHRLPNIYNEKSEIMVMPMGHTYKHHFKGDDSDRNNVSESYHLVSLISVAQTLDKLGQTLDKLRDNWRLWGLKENVAENLKNYIFNYHKKHNLYVYWEDTDRDSRPEDQKDFTIFSNGKTEAFDLQKEEFYNTDIWKKLSQSMIQISVPFSNPTDDEPNDTFVYYHKFRASKYGRFFNQTRDINMVGRVLGINNFTIAKIFADSDLWKKAAKEQLRNLRAPLGI